jgi:uncharacterized protein (DUF58 family)
VKRAAPPPLPPLFPPAFQALLQRLLTMPARLAFARDEQRGKHAPLAQSGTFIGHRRYEHGDDLRRLDWAAYARTGELFVKQLAEDERRTATLLLDLGPRLLAGTPPRGLGLLRLAAVIGGLALVHLDALHVVGGAGSATTFAGAGALPSLLRHLETLPLVTVPPARRLERLLHAGRPGRLHWLADFARPKLDEGLLRALRAAGTKVVGWLPELASDRQAPRAGYLRVQDPETSGELVVPIDRELAAALQGELELLAQKQDRLFAQAGARLVRWATPAADDFALAPWQTIVPWCQR